MFDNPNPDDDGEHHKVEALSRCRGRSDILTSVEQDGIAFVESLDMCWVICAFHLRTSMPELECTLQSTTPVNLLSKST